MTPSELLILKKSLENLSAIDQSSGISFLFRQQESGATELTIIDKTGNSLRSKAALSSPPDEVFIDCSNEKLEYQERFLVKHIDVEAEKIKTIQLHSDRGQDYLLRVVASHPQE